MAGMNPGVAALFTFVFQFVYGSHLCLPAQAWRYSCLTGSGSSGTWSLAVKPAGIICPFASHPQI